MRGKRPQLFDSWQSTLFCHMHSAFLLLRSRLTAKQPRTYLPPPNQSPRLADRRGIAEKMDSRFRGNDAPWERGRPARIDGIPTFAGMTDKALLAQYANIAH